MGVFKCLSGGGGGVVHVVAVVVPRGDGRMGHVVQGVHVWDAWERRIHGAGGAGGV